MRRRASRLAVTAVVVTSVLVLAHGLGVHLNDGADGEADRVASQVDGLVRVDTLTWKSAFDGAQVTALVARPRAIPSRGCVIWQYGLGSRKEDSAQAWQALAALGLTTVSIDLRHHGARASTPDELERVIEDPERLAALIRGTVVDLRGGVDALQERPQCRRNVAYVGISLGGIVGTSLAASDDRVGAVVLMSTPGSFRKVLTTGENPILPGVGDDPDRLEAALDVLSPLDPARAVGRIAPRPVLILSGRQDTTVVPSSARQLQRAAREPKQIINYLGGHDPASGPAAASNAEAVASFLLRHVVEPTYGIEADAPDGTFLERETP